MSLNSRPPCQHPLFISFFLKPFCQPSFIPFPCVSPHRFRIVLDSSTLPLLTFQPGYFFFFFFFWVYVCLCVSPFLSLLRNVASPLSATHWIPVVLSTKVWKPTVFPHILTCPVWRKNHRAPFSKICQLLWKSSFISFVSWDCTSLCWRVQFYKMLVFLSSALGLSLISTLDEEKGNDNCCFDTSSHRIVHLEF